MISTPPAGSQQNAAIIATNVRRLMARHGLTYRDVVVATELDERTVRGVVRGTSTPHARTLHKLAQGLDVSIDELFQPSATTAQRSFDQATNPVVDEIVQTCPELFDRWSEAEFGELYSRFGMGGSLSESGVVAAAEFINTKRSLLRQVGVILESSESELLAEFVNLLYRRVALAEPTVDAVAN
jgi:transcriptional regulator with XRE-family HTH domain